ncbi:MAG: toll/interleukin-1 receptor domain-containing protein [Clostridia bacterium]|nr:toll/interleukin-1 receptor domain-containing protein [Clostridia bacterium]
MYFNNNEYYDVFISYRHDSGFYMANLIYEKLFNNGYNVFLDKRLRSEKTGFEEQLRTAISKSSNFIMVLFPGDLDNSSVNCDDWLEKEARWALEAETPHIIPALCDGFSVKDEILPDNLKQIVEMHGIAISKNYSIDSDIDRLCESFLKNTNPVKQMINTTDFFNNNLEQKNGRPVKRVDLAFHGGGSWRSASRNKPILDRLVDMNVPVRILINTPEAAEIVARFMRDAEADMPSFERLRDSWKFYEERHPDLIEVRACSAPLLHVYHAIEFGSGANDFNKMYDRLHVKYYVYNNYNIDNTYEHELNKYSKYYQMYKSEFEFLWDSSEKI